MSSRADIMACCVNVVTISSIVIDVARLISRCGNMNTQIAKKVHQNANLPVEADREPFVSIALKIMSSNSCIPKHRDQKEVFLVILVSVPSWTIDSLPMKRSINYDGIRKVERRTEINEQIPPALSLSHR